MKAINKPIVLILIVSFFLITLALSACGEISKFGHEPTPTAIPPAPQVQPSPTTELPPLELGNFTAVLTGMGAHGDMVCIDYPGASADLQGLTLQAVISMGELTMEKELPLQEIDGKKCFEMVDAKYVKVNKNGSLQIDDAPLSLEITATSSFRALSNDRQVIALGKYVQYPFVGWLYPTSALLCVNTRHTNMVALDTVPQKSDANQTVVGFPVLSPVQGQVVRVADRQFNVQRTEKIATNAVIIYSPGTGFVTILLHLSADGVAAGETVSLSSIAGREVQIGELFGFIGPKDELSIIPHVHLAIGKPSEPISVSMEESRKIEIMDGMYADWTFIDLVHMHLFLDGSIQKNILSVHQCTLRDTY